MESKRNKNDEWVKLSSKSRPGRFYLFNKATGETQWLPLSKDSENEATKNASKQEAPPKLIAIKPKSATPAQDRLKRLQHNLRQTLSQVTKSTRHTTDSQSKTKKTATEVKEQENPAKDQPTTSSPTKVVTKTIETSPRKHLPSFRKANKRSHSVTEPEILSKSLTSPNKTSRLSETLNISTPSTPKKESLMDTEVICNSSSLLITTNDTQHLPNQAETKSFTFNNFCTGIVKKIKGISKIPFTSSKESAAEKSKAKNKSSSLSSLLKSSVKKNEVNNRLSAALLEEAISQLRADQEKSSDSSKSANTSIYNTPKTINIPSYQRGSANSRLERLRQSLQLQQPFTSTPAKATLSTFAEVSETINNLEQTTNNLTNSTSQSANNTINDEVEAMDWQPTIKEPTKISSSDSVVTNVFKISSTKKEYANNEGTMADIYDTVNENLLRFAAEKCKDLLNNNKWQKEYYYIVVDTNVLLRDLCFIEDLSKMKLCDTAGSMLYLPYSVLQELDALKMRSGCQEGVKTLAVRAIKYLNKKFESKSNHLQAQTALEECNHMIKINCADDSIINCCLQIKEHVPNLLLLTEDVNLRNKAICNNILVSTKSDLVSKHYDTNEDDKP